MKTIGVQEIGIRIDSTLTRLKGNIKLEILEDGKLFRNGSIHVLKDKRQVDIQHDMISCYYLSKSGECCMVNDCRVMVSGEYTEFEETDLPTIGEGVKVVVTQLPVDNLSEFNFNNKRMYNEED